MCVRESLNSGLALAVNRCVCVFMYDCDNNKITKPIICALFSYRNSTKAFVNIKYTAVASLQLVQYSKLVNRLRHTSADMVCAWC